MPRIFASMKSRLRAWSFSANASQTIRVLSAEFPNIRTDPTRRKIPHRSREAGVKAKEARTNSDSMPTQYRWLVIMAGLYARVYQSGYPARNARQEDRGAGSQSEVPSIRIGLRLATASSAA